MFERLFGKPKPPQPPQPPKATPAPLDPKTEAFIAALRERSKVDPLVGAKLGAKEVFQRLLDGMKDGQGVHVESLLTALGALAGYSCQANLRAQALAQGKSETAAFHVVGMADGSRFFFGDHLNNALVNAQYSIWGLAGAAAQDAGAKEMPDVMEIFEYSSSVLGREQFGIPRVPEKHKARDTPINYLKTLWPALFPTVKLFCPEPVHWPVLYGLAIQQAIEAGKGVIDPALALKIVLESAIPMSKVELAKA